MLSKLKIRKNKKQQLVNAFEKIIDSLNYDSELVNYTNKKIINSLQQEFNYQILPVRKNESVGKNEYWDDVKCCFNIDIVKNELENLDKKTFARKSFYDVTFVDDVFTLDKKYSYRNENDRKLVYLKKFCNYSESPLSKDKVRVT